MRTGTPGFNGNRLVEARDVRGITGKALAAVVGVTVGSISHYENGRQTPSSEVLTSLSQALGLPERFFLAPDRPHVDNPIFFRSGASLPERAKKAVDSLLDWVREVVGYVEQYLELPPVKIYDAKLGGDPTAIGNEDIEAAATALRTYWGIGDGAISDVVLLAELNGIVVSRMRLNEDREDALSKRAFDTYRDCVLLNADKDCCVRSRFDLAHELGHLVLHRHVSEDAKTLHHKLLEKQANRFAGAFLLPSTSFFGEFYAPTLEVFERLKPKWKTAMAAMIMRCSDCDVISSEQATKLWKRYRSQKWHKREPLDDTLPVEQPRLLRRSFDMLVENGLQTRRDIRNALTISQRDIEEIAALPKGYLNDGMATVKVLPIKVRGEEPQASEPAKIHQLNRGA